MCEKFLIHIHFKEIAILNARDDLENKELEINVEPPTPTAKIEVEKDDKIASFQNGCQGIKLCFIFQSEDMIDNEDFVFSCLGNGLRVNLSTQIASKSSKKRKSESFKKEVITKGEINLLQLVKRKEEKSFILMEVHGNMEIALSFEITLENAPKIFPSLSIEIDKFLNFHVFQESSIEACIRFPYDEQFRAAMMKKSKSYQESSKLFLIDEMLTTNNFDIETSNSSKIQLFYENYQTELGLKFFHQLIEKKQNLLIEFRIDGKMMMTFIDLDIFNYPGVHEMTFIAPLYEWNKSIIKELFQQEASLKVDKFFDKSGKRISSKRKTIEAEEAEFLVPIIYDEKHAAVSVGIKFSVPRKDEETIEELLLQLNEKFQFIDNENLIEKTLRENHENFKSIIEEIADEFSKFLDENPQTNEKQIKLKMALICEDNKLKDSVEALIGNVYNVEKKTESNHEFKLLMIEVFKSLNRKMMKILSNKWFNDEKRKESTLDDNLRRNQIEEWMVLDNKARINEILNNQLNNDEGNVKKLEELAFYQMKLKNFKECQTTILKILKIDKFNALALYLLSYITYNDYDINFAMISTKCLQKLIPGSMEILMILKKLFEDISFTAGIKYCKIHLRGSESIPIYSFESIVNPQITSNNKIIKILHQQLNLKLDKFLEITKKYLQGQNDFEVKIFNSIEALEACKFNETLGILKSIEINDENEMIIRILKGNALYSSHHQWRAVCEYEIAYNLCLKGGDKFPHIPALRCGLWYLHDMNNTTKARRYFNFCCKNFATFHSWNGFGVVNMMEMSYENAEKCFNCANQIHKNCGGNWIYLALVNCKLKRMDIALECYLTAKNCGVKENEILFEVERELKI